MIKRPMKKAAVLKAWMRHVVDAERNNGWGHALKNATMEEKCIALLMLVHAGVALNGWRFDLERAEMWAPEVAAMVQKELG